MKGGKKASSGGDKDVILRAESIEKLVNWMNCIAEAAALEYDVAGGLWVKGPRVKKANPKALNKSSTMPVNGHSAHEVSFTRSWDMLLRSINNHVHVIRRSIAAPRHFPI
jgi:hypothetical protein